MAGAAPLSAPGRPPRPGLELSVLLKGERPVRPSSLANGVGFAPSLRLLTLRGSGLAAHGTLTGAQPLLVAFLLGGAKFVTLLPAVGVLTERHS